MSVLYEEYARKIRRVASVRDAILKFKVLIIAVISVALAAYAGYLATAGIITEALNGRTEYVYGDSISFAAKALFSDVRYEYSTDGDEWSDETPVAPGEYSVRAVSEKSFGRQGYSDPLTFTIAKKDAVLSINESDLQWKMSATASADGLVKNDTLENASVVLDSSDLGLTQANIDADSIIIRDENGNDVTDCYDLELQPKALNVIARTLTLKPLDVQKVYDGNSLEADGYTVLSGEAPEGHTLKVEFYAVALTDVGTADIVIKDVKVLDGERDVTFNCNIATHKGKATVTARPLTVAADSVSREYDGTPLVLPEWYIKDGTVAAAHTICVDTFEGEIVTPQVVPEFISCVTLTDAFGEDVTANYDITIDNATLSVNKRFIKIDFPSVTKEYDGKPLDVADPYISSGSLLEGHQTVLSFSVDKTTLVKPIRVENYIESCVITFGSEDISHLYEITVVNNVLEITKREITVTTPSASKIYDGYSLHVPEVEVNGLVDGHVFEANFFTMIAEVGSDVNGYNSYRILSEYGEDVVDCYTVIEDLGTLTVYARPITVKLYALEKDYDNEAVYISDGDYSITEGTLAEGDVMYVNIVGIFINACRDKPYTANIMINAAGGWVNTDNYDITNDYSEATVTIRSKIITVTAEDITVMYKDSLYYAEDFIGNGITVDAYLEDGHRLYYAFKGDLSYIDVGKFNYSLDFLVRDLFGRDVSENYEFNYTYTNDTYSLITIEKRPITVLTGTASFVYNGEAQFYKHVEVTSDITLAYMNSIHITAWPTLTDVGSCRNALGFDIIGMNNSVVTDNYDITIEYGTLTVTPRPMHVITASEYRTYDGKTYSNSTGTRDGLVTGHSILISDYTIAGPDVGEYENRYVVNVLDRNRKNVTHNYEITYEYGIITIAPRPIYIRTASASKIYDGTPLEKHEYSFEDIGDSSGVLAEHSLLVDIEYTGVRIGVGISENTAEAAITVRDKNGKDITHNYSLVLWCGALEVKPIALTFKPLTVVKTYDGTPLSATGGKLSDGALLGDDKVLFVSVSGSATQAGQHKSFVDIAVVKSGDMYIVFQRGVSPAETCFVRMEEGIDIYYTIDGYYYLRITPDDRVSLVERSLGYHTRNLELLYTYVDEVGATSEYCKYAPVFGEGQITINKRKVVITCDSITESYSAGKKLTGGCRITTGSMIDGHYLSAPTSGSATRQGQTAVNTVYLSDIRIYSNADMSDSHDITSKVYDNYDFVIETGKLILQ